MNSLGFESRDLTSNYVFKMQKQLLLNTMQYYLCVVVVGIISLKE